MSTAPHQWIKCLGRKGRGIRSRSKICRVKKLSPSASRAATPPPPPPPSRSLVLAGLPTTLSFFFFLNGPVPRPQRVSLRDDDVEAVTLDRAGPIGSEARSTTWPMSPLWKRRSRSLMSVNDTPRYSSASWQQHRCLCKKREEKKKTILPRPIFFLCHIMLTGLDKGGEQKWPRPSSFL